MTKRKIALVTGGSRGLGKNMALSLAKKGLDLILTYRSRQEEAGQVKKEIENLGRKAAVLSLDVSQAGSFDAFVSSVGDILESQFGTGKLDYLINNAGIGIHAEFDKTAEEDLDQLYRIHLKGPFLLSQKMLPLMSDGGGIVNVSTGLTRIIFPGYSAYGAMKGAAEVMTKYMAKELGPRKINVNIVAPGAIETDFGRGVVRDNQEVNQFISANTALGRVGLPDDIGGVVAFLCTDDARWINAQRIEVSGGQMI